MAVNNLNTPGVGIQPSLIDAKGDLLVGTANDAIDRLGVTGTTGAVLTADAGETTGLKWAAAGSVGGLVHIETQDFSAVSSFSFSNDVFTSTYENYYLLCSFDASTSIDVLWRGRTAGVDNSSASYAFQRTTFTDTSFNSARVTGATSTRFAAGTSTGRNAFSSHIFAPNIAKRTITNSIGFSSLNTVVVENYGSTFADTTVFDSISVICSSGNITGKAILYGCRQ
jgi:hypothetical protein